MLKKRSDAPSPLQILTGLVKSLRTRSLPSGDSFADCLARAGFHLVDEYVTRDTPLTDALDRLLLAFSNRKDPFVATFEPMVHIGVMGTLNAVRAQRERRRESERQRQAAEATGGVTGSDSR